MSAKQYKHKQQRYHTNGVPLSEAEAYLHAADPVMAQLVDTHGPCQIAERKTTHYQTLATSIIGQQLSAKAAGTIKQRVLALAPNFTARSILSLSSESLRNTGLSSSKIRYIMALSQQTCDGRLDFDSLSQQTDEEVISTLTALPGIGRWTAEMFLIFSLKRPDVLALGDAGLQRAVRLLYGPTAELEKAGRKWRPHASTASWYLWRHLDT